MFESPSDTFTKFYFSATGYTRKASTFSRVIGMLVFVVIGRKKEGSRANKRTKQGVACEQALHLGDIVKSIH